MSMNARKAAVLIENAAIEVQDRPYLAPADDEVELRSAGLVYVLQILSVASIMVYRIARDGA